MSASPLHPTHDICRLEHQRERDEVAEHEATEQHVRELTASRLDHGGVVVLQERGHDEQRDQETCEREAHGSYRPGTLSAQVVLGDLQTDLVQRVGPGALPAHDANRLVHRVPDLEGGNTSYFVI